MEIEFVNVKDLIEDKDNPNVMDEATYKALKRSINTYGMLNPIIVDRTYHVIDGHHRLKVAKEVEMPQVPILKVNLDKKADQKLIQQILNKIKGKHEAKKDAVALTAIMDEYSIEDISTLLAQSEQELLKILSVLTESEEVPKVEPEQVKQLGKHVITCPACNHTFQRE